MISTVVERKNYEDVTNEFIKSAKPNIHKVKDAKYFEDENGIRYFVDSKNVVLDYSQKEYEIALWLAKNFGGEILMCPGVNNPDGIKTPDYIWNKCNWDLKEVNGNNGRVLDNLIKGKKKQAQNFIFDIKNINVISKIEKQINEIYNSKYRFWVDTIIIKYNNDNFNVYKRKEIDRNPMRETTNLNN